MNKCSICGFHNTCINCEIVVNALHEAGYGKVNKECEELSAENDAFRNLVNKQGDEILELKEKKVEIDEKELYKVLFDAEFTHNHYRGGLTLAGFLVKRIIKNKDKWLI